MLSRWLTCTLPQTRHLAPSPPNAWCQMPSEYDTPDPSVYLLTPEAREQLLAIRERVMRLAAEARERLMRTEDAFRQSRERLGRGHGEPQPT
jgi:hypothetical protein